MTEKNCRTSALMASSLRLTAVGWRLSAVSWRRAARHAISASRRAVWIAYPGTSNSGIGRYISATNAFTCQSSFLKLATYGEIWRGLR